MYSKSEIFRVSIPLPHAACDLKVLGNIWSDAFVFEGHERSLSTGLSQIKSSLNSSGGSNQAATRLKSVTFSAISIESLEPMSFCQVSSLGSEETPVDIRSFLAEPYLGEPFPSLTETTN